GGGIVEVADQPPSTAQAVARREAVEQGGLLGGGAVELDRLARQVAADQIGRRAVGDHLAGGDDRHPVAEPLRLVHVVGGEQDGGAGGAQVADAGPQREA